jgi:hypothetical protein
MRENDPVRSESKPETPSVASGRRVWALVVVLLVIPGALYAAVPVVPFLPLTTAQKIGLSSGLVVAAEVVFWVAALFVGKEVISRYRRFFDPRVWFRRR